MKTKDLDFQESRKKQWITLNCHLSITDVQNHYLRCYCLHFISKVTMFLVTGDKCFLYFLSQEMLEESCNYPVFSNAVVHFWSGILFQHRTAEQGDLSWVLQYLWSRLILPPWGGLFPCLRSPSKCHTNQFDFSPCHILPGRQLLKSSAPAVVRLSRCVPIWIVFHSQ